MMAAAVTLIPELLGGANWWLPRWLDRVLPRIRIEEGELPKPAPAPAGASR